MLSSLFAAMGQGVSECKPCSVKADPIKDTVSVDPTLLQQPCPGSPKLFEEQQVDLDQQEEKRLAGERVEEARQRALAEDEAERAARAVEEQLRAEESERQEQQRIAKAERQDQQRLAEKGQRERQEEERGQAEAAAAKEAEKAVAVAKQEARKVVDTFLKKRGFKSLAAPRKAFCGPAVYPFFLAVEDGDVELVKAILLCDASISNQKNASGKTARQVAERRNSGGSHAAVLAALP